MAYSVKIFTESTNCSFIGSGERDARNLRKSDRLR
jgi:hypothetical protein